MTLVRRLLACLVIAGVLPGGLALAGQRAATTEPPGAALALPDGVHVGVEFPRYLMVERRLEAIIDNQSDVDVTVIDIALRSPLFEPVAPDVHDYRVAAGLRQDLQMAVGPSICPPADEPTSIAMTVDVDGERRHGLVEIDASPIARINTRECGQEFVLDRSDVGFGPDFTVVDDVMTTAVTLTRREGDEPIAVTNVRGSVLFTIQPIEPAAVPLAVMAAGDTTAAAPIRIHVGRCEAHAVADAKKPYQFAVWVTVGESEPYFLELAPEGELRAALAEMLQACIAADGATG